jgi:hypothetical protein
LRYTSAPFALAFPPFVITRLVRVIHLPAYAKIMDCPDKPGNDD